MTTLLRLLFTSGHPEKPCEFSFLQFGKMPALKLDGVTVTDNGLPYSYVDIDTDKAKAIVDYLNSLINTGNTK